MANDAFLGTGMKFPPQIDQATGRFVTVSSNQIVKESIYLILMTQRTERLAREDFGSEIMSYTFMDTSITMMNIMRRNLTQTILSQEPRISDLEVDTEFNDRQGMILIRISYTVSETNTRDNLVFPFYLNSGEEPEEAEDEDILMPTGERNVRYMDEDY